jgi:hypothetical protein
MSAFFRCAACETEIQSNRYEQLEDICKHFMWLILNTPTKVV